MLKYLIYKCFIYLELYICYLTLHLSLFLVQTAKSNLRYKTDINKALGANGHRDKTCVVCLYEHEKDTHTVWDLCSQLVLYNDLSLSSGV